MKKTLGMMIAELRKQHGMTQLELAEKMGVTDKAVSKWERDLSCPDINSIPKLAEILGVSVEELMQVKKEAEEPVSKVSEALEVIPKALALAMGVAVTVLTILDAMDAKSGMILLGLGLACVGISLLNSKNKISQQSCTPGAWLLFLWEMRQSVFFVDFSCRSFKIRVVICLSRQTGKLLFTAPNKRCHCEEAVRRGNPPVLPRSS